MNDMPADGRMVRHTEDAIPQAFELVHHLSGLSLLRGF